MAYPDIHFCWTNLSCHHTGPLWPQHAATRHWRKCEVGRGEQVPSMLVGMRTLFSQGEASREAWIVFYSYMHMHALCIGLGGGTREKATLLLLSGCSITDSTHADSCLLGDIDWDFLQQRNLGLLGAVPEHNEAVAWSQPVRSRFRSPFCF